MPLPPDYYEVLQVSPNADEEIIQAAYRRLAMKWHPDRRAGDSSASEHMKLINKAYEVLSTPQKRQEYDLLRRRAGLSGGAASAAWQAAEERERAEQRKREEERQRQEAERRRQEQERQNREAEAQRSRQEVYCGDKLKGTVSPTACTLFMIGTALFLLGHFDIALGGPPAGPLAFLLTCLVWGLTFGVPAYLCFPSKRRNGMTVVAVLFFLASGLDAAVLFSKPAATTFRPRSGQFSLQTSSLEELPESMRPQTAVWTTTNTYLDEIPPEMRPALPLDPEARKLALNQFFQDSNLQHAFNKLEGAQETTRSYLARRALPGGSALLAHRQAQEYDAARKRFEEGIPRLEDYDTIAGYERMQQLDQARQGARVQVREPSKEALVCNDRGIALIDKEEYDKAIEAFNEAIRLEPGYAAAYKGRGNAWAKKGKYDKAIQDFSEAIRLNPQYAQAYNNRGLAWAHKKEYNRAILDYNEAIRFNPNYAHAYGNRGLAWAYWQEYDKAIQDYDEAIRLDPQYEVAHWNRSAALSLKKAGPRRGKTQAEILKSLSKEAIAANDRGNALTGKKDFDNAIREFNEAIRLDPNYAAAYHNRGNAWLLKEDFDNAIASYKEAMRLAPEGGPVWNFACSHLQGALNGKREREAAQHPHGSKTTVPHEAVTRANAVAQRTDVQLPKVVNQFGQNLGRGTVGIPRGASSADPNAGVLNYARSKLNGTGVGDGMCWALVDWALADAGAKRPEEVSKRGRSYGKKVPFSEARPGDIVTMEKVTLANGGKIEDHVAIVSGVQGDQVQVIHQNAGTPEQARKVRQDWFDFAGHTGTITYWRPQPR